MLIVITILWGCGPGHPTSDPMPVSQAPALTGPVPRETLFFEIPELADYFTDLNQILASPLPVMSLSENAMPDKRQQLAQQIALAHPPFVKDAWERDSGAPLRTEITEVRQLEKLETQRMGLDCENGQCYIVRLYNYFHHTTTAALVDVFQKKVIRVEDRTEEPQVLGPRLEDLSRKIALANPQLRTNWGEGLGKAGIKHQNCKCERSLHLCTNVIFTFPDKALWTLVDLNDFQLLGYKWGDLPDEKRPFVLTERNLQNEFVMDQYCQVDHTLKMDDWEIVYQLTSSDGLEVKEVKFRGREMLHSAKIVDWHVSYTNQERFGYSDAMGCPMFSSAANVAFRGTEVEEIIENGQPAGFALIMDFRSPVWPLPCNYRYQNRFEFYRDGRFRICGVNMGQGCGVTGWYRPVIRIDLAGAAVPHTIEQWQEDGWKVKDREFWHEQDPSTAYSPEGYLFKISNEGQQAGFYLQPSRGQFVVDGKGDNAFSYFVTDHGEGAGDLPTFGDCCNEDYRQGPEQFLEPAESLTGKSTVLWYVPQMANNNQPGKQYCWTELTIEKGQQAFEVWPGIVGPMFVPFTMEK